MKLVVGVDVEDWPLPYFVFRAHRDVGDEKGDLDLTRPLRKAHELGHISRGWVIDGEHHEIQLVARHSRADVALQVAHRLQPDQH